jgi:3-methyladenine DNA glycosylase Tag
VKKFQWLYEHALQHKGASLESLLPEALSNTVLTSIADDYIFSTLTRRIFRAGLKHSLVDSKWPAFEQALHGFDPYKVALMSDDQLENLMQNDQIIRHWGKIKATRLNAVMMLEMAEKHGSCAQWIAGWPEDDIIGLWRELKANGSHLGGNSGAYFLRMLGKDTFVLTDDVVAALKAQGIVDKRPTGKKDLQAVQDAFNEWRDESQRPLCHISCLLSFTVGW